MPLSLADLYAQANQRNALSRRREPLDAPFDPLRQIPQGMTPALRTGDVLSASLQNAPGIGDVASLIDAYRAWQMGDKLQGGLSAVAALPFVGAINAYHGSPHKFDAFDMSKIGTGEGAQAYGHGLYFSQAPEVAKTYADTLGEVVNIKGKPAYNAMTGAVAGDLPISNGARMALQGSGWDLRKARDAMADAFDTSGDAYFKRAFDELNALTGDDITRETGHLYETSLEWPDPAREAADPLGPQHFLDWDRPIAQQAPEVQKTFGDVDPNGRIGTGLAYERWRAKQGVDPIAASKQLQELGIPGIRYADAGSRGAAGGTSNFVVFDDQIPKITARNGEPLQRPDLTRQGIGAGPLRMATNDELTAALEAVHGRNAAKGLDMDIATGAIRDEQARRNAVSMLGLPESNTAAERARAMGYMTDAYHGTTAQDLPAFSPEKIKDRFGYSFGHHTTTRPAEANYYAHNSLDLNRNPYPTGGNVLPLTIKGGRTLEYASDSPAKSASMVADTDRGMIIEDLVKAKRAGEPVDIVKTSRNFGDDYDGANLIAMRPELLRSRFAAFDPARRDSSNLLAQILGGVGLSHLYAAMTARPEERQ
jgi:hypothetical protein